MINKIKGYDETVINEDFKVLEAGAYICKIVGAKTEKDRNDVDMLVLALDIAEGEYKEYYKQQYAARVKTTPDSKWLCTKRISLAEDKVKYLKMDINSIEKSNEGYKWAWDEKTLVGKKVGGVFRREQFKNQNSEYKFSTKLWYLTSIQKVNEGIKPPEDKLLDETKTVPPENSRFFDFNVPQTESLPGDLPF